MHADEFDNPLDLTPEREQRIRERAYYLWQHEGEPVGREADYWERARELEALHTPVGLVDNPMITHPDGPPVLDIVEEAEIQQNLGEFPDRFADQGEVSPTPMPRRSLRRARTSKATVQET